jgi:PAS domain S-box-containing protein
MPLLCRLSILGFSLLFYQLLGISILLAPDPVAAADRIRVGIYDNKPLVFMDVNGKPGGLFVDILNTIAVRKNLKIDYVYGHFSDGLERLEDGKIDLLAAIAYSETRAERFDFTYETVITNWGEIYATKGQGIESILDLAGKRIGVKHGDIHFEALRRLTGEFGIECRFIEGDGYDMVFEMLEAEFLSLGLVNHFYGRQKRGHAKVAVTPVIFNPIEVKYAARKGSNSDLLFAVDSELARLKQKQGSVYYRSLERWMMPGGETAFPRGLIYFGVVSLIALILLLCGNLILRHRVNLRTRELSTANERLQEEINERRIAEEELRKSEKVVAASSDAMALLDPQGIVQMVNPAYLEILGQPRQAVIGHGLEALYAPDFLTNTLRPQLNACLRGRTVRHQATWPHAATGEFEAELTCSPYLDQEGRLCGTVLNIRDITENQNLAARLKQAQKMEAIGTLAGGVAHDLNNILSGLVGYPDILLMDLPSDSPHLPAVRVIKNSGEKAAAIVQDMLTLARRAVEQRKPLDINTIIRDLLASPESQHIQELYPDVIYQVDLAPRPLTLVGSEVHLAKSILNLITNAAEAMPEGGELYLKTSFENALPEAEVVGAAAVAGAVAEADAEAVADEDPKGHPGHGYVCIEVADTGTGIAPEDREHIFEPFYTRKVMGRSGTGLGMAVVWGTVNDHHGQIEVTSQLGQGTRFMIYLPLSEATLPVEAPRLKGLQTGAGEAILVIDDETSQRQLARELITRLGYEITTADGGRTALEKIAAKNFDLVILDMIMPGGMDGLDTYQAIRALRPDQKTIIVSGYSESERVRAAQLLGAGTYLRKPYTVENLARAIYAALNDLPDG